MLSKNKSELEKKRLKDSKKMIWQWRKCNPITKIQLKSYIFK